jgi:hypothetical protein
MHLQFVTFVVYDKIRLTVSIMTCFYKLTLLRMHAQP